MFSFPCPACCTWCTCSGTGIGLRSLARKLLIFSLAIVLVIPVSVKVSDLIEDTYQAPSPSTLETAKETTAEVEENAADADQNSDEASCPDSSPRSPTHHRRGLGHHRQGGHHGE